MSIASAEKKKKKKKLACTLALLDTMHTEVGMREMHFRVRLIKGMRRNQKLDGKEQKKKNAHHSCIH